MSTEYYHIYISREDNGNGWIEYDKLIEHTNVNLDLFFKQIRNAICIINIGNRS